MVEARELERDPVLVALANLSEVASSSASDLVELNEGLAALRKNRLEGWTWQKIIAEGGANPLSSFAKIAANLARACGGFRRALAMGLRNEGLQVTEIASMFDVSRQRVSALIRPGGPQISAEGDPAEADGRVAALAE